MNNPFTKIFSSFGTLGGGDNDRAIGIDIGSSAIKVVEIKKKGGKAVLETYGSIALGPYADLDVGRVTNLPVEKIADGLKEVLKQAGVTGSSGALAIPVQSSLIFIIELPAQIKSSDMGSIVPTEARKYIPVPITEVSLDYFILPDKEPSFEEMNNPEMQLKNEDKIRVLVVATQNDAVSRYRSIASQANFDASFFEIEVFSSIRSNFEHELSPVLLIDLGASRTKLSIVEFGMIKSYHTIDRGGADITESISKSLNIPFYEAEKMKKEFGLFENTNERTLSDIIKVHLDYIFSETNNVLLSYEKKYNRTISKVILTGGGSLMKGFREMAVSNFKAEIELGHPFEKVGAPAFLDKVLEAMGPEFAVALGLALRKLQ
ncbi:MAG: type IV pilus assembly protein PilM [Candidatus Pacebacteria bacterium]|nr:type IV pilus assembly protein PilM [Candidatus Paceibacterota bacterium]